MPRNVILAAHFPAPPGRLYEMYLDPREHAAITGLPVTIDRRPGSSFRAFDGMLSGTMLHVQPERLIVQAWRSVNWPADAIDSTLTLSFWAEDGGGRIELAHINVPDPDFAGVSLGWAKYYWTPWQKYLDAQIFNPTPSDGGIRKP